MKKSKFMVMDVETGGLDPMSNPITQFAATVLDYNTLQEIDRFETFVRPYNELKIERAALDKTMLTMTQINSGLPVEEFVSQMVAFWKKHRASTADIGRSIAVGHNINFDACFLTYALALCGYQWEDFFQEVMVDTMYLGKMVWCLTGSEKLTLGACCERAGISLVDAHGAMNDAEATADLFRFFVRRMRNGQQETTRTSRADRPRGAAFFEFECGATTVK